MTERNLRILLAEGPSGEAAATLRELFPDNENRLDLTMVPTVSTLLPTIQVVNPEIILLDLALARPEPLEVVRRVHRSAPDVALIVLADAADKETAAQCLEEGALDYLLKGFMDPQSVDRALRVAFKHNTVAGLVDLLRDPQTGLHIREGLLALGAHAIKAANRKHGTLVLLCIRIDDLEWQRAQFGSGAAESSLRAVAGMLKSNFRRTDFIARIGESQFAALAADAVEPSGPALRERLEKRIAALKGGAGSGGPLELRISVGFWSSSRTDGFSEFLDSVEAGLRGAPASSGEQPAPRGPVA
jgi:two-component system cell cycle response regulator